MRSCPLPIDVFGSRHRTIRNVLLILALAPMGLSAQGVRIGAEEFHLAYAPADSASRLREYLPANDSLKSWEKLLSFREFPDVDAPVTYIGQLARTYRSRFPALKFEVVRDTSGPDGDYGIDFLIPDRDGFEWNLFRVTRRSAGGVLVFQLAHRIAPSDANAPFIRTLRERYQLAVMSPAFPREDPSIPAWQEVARASRDTPSPDTPTTTAEEYPQPVLAPPLTPSEAIALATASPHGIERRVEFVVQGSGRDRGWLYLNSLANFRDPACLTIAIRPDLAPVVDRDFGGDAARRLRGQVITAKGVLRRVRIDYVRNGIPSGDHYFQTHLQLQSAAELVPAAQTP